MPDAQFHLHHFPRQENLADDLLEKLRAEGAGKPFHPSTVLVRNQGMATWLRQRLARQTGLAMLIDFPQPNRFLQNLLDESSVQLDDLKWPIFEVLPSLSQRPEFSLIRSYLSAQSPNSDLKRYQLASQLASLFDKYLLYRPQWITSWNRGEAAKTYNPHEPWQRLLWQELQQKNIQHWSQKLLNSEQLESLENLPGALHVFGISNFAPIYVHFLYLLSHQIPVHIYWMNPVSADQGYWEDAATNRQWTMAKAYEEHEILDDSNLLLASLGRMGREFVHTIYGGDTGNVDVINEQVHHEQGHPSDRAPSASTLSTLQESIYQRKPMPENTPLDDSIRLHACHTPQRELETLKDYLMGLAEQQPLDTGEVIVLCPDISRYAPAIEAVFGDNSQEKSLYLPYRISDRSAPIHDPAIAAVAKLFTLNQTRFSNREAIDLLSTPAIAGQFGIDEDQISQIQQWIQQSGIRWGFDAHHVQEIAPDCASSPWTWRAGLDRLLLGFAMPSLRPDLWHGISPFHDIEGHATTLLGSLCGFIDWCASIRKDLQEKRTLDGWVNQTRQWIDAGFSKTSEALQQLQPLLETLELLQKQAIHLSEPIPSEIFMEHLDGYLNDSSPAHGFLNGSITFCETKPMRAIPARVICLLGMDHDAFPRSSSEIQFDLTKNQRVAGDRSTRDDDCYFFLEALLSARKNLYLSYIGASVKDGSDRPPSTVIQTLIEMIPSLTKTCQLEKLHAFDPHYFSADDPISFRKNMLSSAEKLIKADTPVEPRCSIKINHTEAPQQLSIDQLIQGIIKSAKHHSSHSLQASRAYSESPLKESESIEIDALSAYGLKTQIARYKDDLSLLPETWRQDGSVPTGELGALALLKSVGSLDELAARIPDTSSHHLEVTIQGITISGNVSLDDSGTLVSLDFSKSVKGAKLMALWIQQLLLSEATGSPHPAKVINLSGDNRSLNPPTESKVHLETVISLYLANLKQAQPIFPKSQYAFVRTKGTQKDGPDELAAKRLKAAQKEWRDGYTLPGEGSDQDIATFFTEKDLSTKAFNAVIKNLWLPLQESIAESEST